MHLVVGVNHLTFLHSHRRPVVVAALARGWKVSIISAAPDDDRSAAAAIDFEKSGASLVFVRLAHGSTSPLDALRGIIDFYAAMRRLKPDVVHLVSPIAILVGGIAARMARVPAVVVAISGLGALDSDVPGVSNPTKAMARLGTRFALRQPRISVIVQNSRDFAVLREIAPRHADISLLPGSGVDLTRFLQTPIPPGPIRVLLSSRLLRTKGIPEFIDAARKLKAKGVPVRMAICGEPYESNPDSMKLSDFSQELSDGTIEYVGFVSNMPAELANAAVACLPSRYAEGLPLALAEAAAAGRPIVTTDTPGCRDTVQDGVSGFLVPPGQSQALADAIEKLAADRALVERMGIASRKLAEERFDLRNIVDAHLSIYESLHERA